MSKKRSFVHLHGSAIAKRDGGWFCFYCGIALKRVNINKPHKLARLRAMGYGAATVDHLKPLSKKGSRKRSNMVLACWDCNERKGDSDAKTFIISMELSRVLKNQDRKDKPSWHRG